jgi:DNA-binding beta-propeller fold protein YncE
MRRHLAGTVVLALLAFLAVASSAIAAAGDPSLDQCFSGTATPPCTQISPNFTGMEPKVSPDGNQVYLLGYNPPQVRIFDRGPGNKLTPRAGAGSCFNATGAEGCTALSGLGGVGYDLDISPDGRSLYVASGSLSHLQRDPSTGNLTPAGCYGQAAGCTPFAPLAAAYAVVVSNDSQSVYTRGGNTFGAFQRSQVNGALIPEPDGEDCFSESSTPGCTDTYGLSGNAFEMDFSPDGKFLYYPIQSPGGIGFFQRSANGTLTQISGVQGGCITTDGSSTAANECASIPDGSGPAMSNGWAATVAPSGRYAFLSGSSGTIVFSRDQETGKLTKTYCITPGTINSCNQRKGSAGMGVAVSPDGTRAIVGSSDIGGIGAYDFNEATGGLSQLPSPLGCFAGFAAAGCGTFPGGAQYGKIAWAADGLNFYAAATGPLVNMAVDAAPVCQNRAATVLPNISTAVGLSCTDPTAIP